MKKKAQEINPAGLIGGVIGFIVGWLIGAGLDYGLIMKLIVAGLTGVINYFIVSTMSNN